MVTQVIGRTVPKVEPSSAAAYAAARLGPLDRIALSVHTLARTEPVARMACRNGVSRKFIYKQAAKADKALKEAFEKTPEKEKVLFHLPVTKSWITQFVLAQILIGHTAYRGVQELLATMFDYHAISIGTIHNIVKDAVSKARSINEKQELSNVRHGAHDEIYQTGTPVLVGADIRSTYCYLMAAEDACDETTWGVHLLDLIDQGLAPDFINADFGKPLRAGHKAVWGSTPPCHGDVFHIERAIGTLVFFLARRASGCTTTRKKLEDQMERAKKRKKGASLSKKLAYARQEETKTVALARDIRILAEWLQGDILSLAGADLAVRTELFDFIVEELQLREPLCPHRIRPVRTTLQNQRPELLAFVGVLDEKFAEIATRFGVPVCLIHAVCELQGMDNAHPAYWQHEAVLRRKLRHSFYNVEQAVKQAFADTPRASSIVENLNGRLRCYFFLRRHIGNEYLELLRFFLNHRRFIRSTRPERAGRSPAELLMGKNHPHWIEMLGFELFTRN